MARISSAVSICIPPSRSWLPPADGYTSGQALKAIDEVAKTTLPAGFDYELGGMAREEASTSGSTTALIFLLCFVFVYLLLSAQYESYIFLCPYCFPCRSV